MLSLVDVADCFAPLARLFPALDKTAKAVETADGTAHIRCLERKLAYLEKKAPDLARCAEHRIAFEDALAAHPTLGADFDAIGEPHVLSVLAQYLAPMDLEAKGRELVPLRAQTLLRSTLAQCSRGLRNVLMEVQAVSDRSLLDARAQARDQTITVYISAGPANGIAGE